MRSGSGNLNFSYPSTDVVVMAGLGDFLMAPADLLVGEALSDLLLEPYDFGNDSYLAAYVAAIFSFAIY